MPRSSDLPANNPSRLIEQLKRQLDEPAVHQMLHDHADQRVDITFRVTRRGAVKGPVFTIVRLPG